MGRTRYSRMLRLVAAVFVAAIGIWVFVSALLFVAMRQTPARFGAVMSYVPPVAMLVLPFRPLWMVARAGTLGVDDLAPDFSLPVLNSDQQVRLSDILKQKPVVLVFGSYT